MEKSGELVKNWHFKKI